MTHLSPSFWVHTTSKCSDKSSCSQTKAPCEKLCFCFEMKILPFSGILSEVRSIVEITKGVQSRILDHKFLKLWTYQPRPPPLYLSLHTGADTQALLTQCLPVECIVFFVCLFIQILIDHYPLSKEEFNKNSSGSHFECTLMECIHVLSPMMPDKCSIDEDFYKQPFVFQQLHNLTDSCASHMVRGKHSCSFTHHSTWSAIPPYTAAYERTCKYISMPFACNGCLSKLCHDGCDGRESGDQTEMH